jgi:methyltransferase (TIGR00027 family)
MEANGLPSRTSILTAAARAFGSREPDASVRNPDFLAGRLIGPAERALIAEHALSRALDQDFAEACQNPDIFGFAWLMLVRTRFIDELLERAVSSGARQIVILGAGFDTRAHRFAELLKDCVVIEVDYGATQEYKKQRVADAIGSQPANLVYTPIDFAHEDLGDVLHRAGFRPTEKTFFICEGVSMYVPEPGVRATLGTVARSAPGSSLMLEYMNRGGIEFSAKYPMGVVKHAIDWGEPFVFGVPDGQDREFFQECGLQLGEALKVGSPETIKRYATRGDGTAYGSHLFASFQKRALEAAQAIPEEVRQEAAKLASAAGYWLAELHVPELPS